MSEFLDGLNVSLLLLSPLIAAPVIASNIGSHHQPNFHRQRGKDLISHNVRCQDELEFVSLPEKKVWKYLQQAMKPLSVPEFATSRKNAACFTRREEFALTYDTYDQLYGDLITYTRLFLRVFTFLSHKKFTNIPVVDNKPGGLIKYIWITSLVILPSESVMSQLRASLWIESFIVDTFMPMVNGLAQKMRVMNTVKPFLDPVSLPTAKPRTDAKLPSRRLDRHRQQPQL
jgi:hypothetical protein